MLDGGRHIGIVAPRGEVEVVAQGNELVGVGNHGDVLLLLEGLGRELHEVGVVGVVAVPGVADVDVTLATGDSFEVGAYHGRLRRDTEREGVDARHLTRIGRDVDRLAIGAEFSGSGDADGRECLEGLGIDNLDAVLFLRGDVEFGTAKKSVVGRTAEGSSIGRLEGIGGDAVCGEVDVVERPADLAVETAFVEDKEAVGHGHVLVGNLWLIVIACGEDEGACKEAGKKLCDFFHCFVILKIKH